VPLAVWAVVAGCAIVALAGSLVAGYVVTTCVVMDGGGGGGRAYDPKRKVVCRCGPRRALATRVDEGSNGGRLSTASTVLQLLNGTLAAALGVWLVVGAVWLLPLRERGHHCDPALFSLAFYLILVAAVALAVVLLAACLLACCATVCAVSVTAVAHGMMTAVLRSAGFAPGLRGHTPPASDSGGVGGGGSSGSGGGGVAGMFQDFYRAVRGGTGGGTGNGSGSAAAGADVAVGHSTSAADESHPLLAHRGGGGSGGGGSAGGSDVEAPAAAPVPYPFATAATAGGGEAGGGGELQPALL